MKIKINSRAGYEKHSHVWYHKRVGEVFEAVYETDPKYGILKGLVRITDKSVGRKFATPDVYDIVYELPSELFETLD